MIFRTLNPRSYLKFKLKITSKIPNDGDTRNVEIIVPLKYLNNFWITLEKLLIYYETNLMLISRADCLISCATWATTFTITNKKLYTPVITPLLGDNNVMIDERNFFDQTVKDDIKT